MGTRARVVCVCARAVCVWQYKGSVDQRGLSNVLCASLIDRTFFFSSLSLSKKRFCRSTWAPLLCLCRTGVVNLCTPGKKQKQNLWKMSYCIWLPMRSQYLLILLIFFFTIKGCFLFPSDCLLTFQNFQNFRISAVNVCTPATHMYVCIRTYVCMHAYMYICIYVYIEYTDFSEFLLSTCVHQPHARALSRTNSQSIPSGIVVCISKCTKALTFQIFFPSTLPRRASSWRHEWAKVLKDFFLLFFLRMSKGAICVLCMYVCMYVCMCVYTYLCMYTSCMCFI